MDVPFADGLLYRWTRHAAARSPVQSLTTLDKTALRSVLLVLTTGLGDAVLSTPVFSAVRAALPRARVTLFVRAAWAPLFAAERDIDEVIPYHGKWRRFVATLRRLRGTAPDLVLILHGNDPDILPLAYWSGSRRIVRVPTSGTRYAWLLSNAGRIEDATTLPDRHYIENRLRVLDSVGIPPLRHTPVVHPPQTAVLAVADWRRRVLGDAPYWVFHPWAADRYKTWPHAQARAFIVDALARWPDRRIVLTGTGREREATQMLAAELDTDKVVVAAGVFNIAETAALLASADAVVAPDTGLLHLAAALDVPVVGLYAPTSSVLVGPRAEHAPVRALQQPQTCTPCLEKRCPYPHALCMAQFQPAQVLRALAECLSR